MQDPHTYGSNHQMPAPCTNCVRFHYGQCYEPIKYCRECGGINHIERYCPNNRNTIQRVRGEPLAGTREWQEMHGLQHDPELRFRVLQSLKTSPGTAIHVNGVCIYRGYERHFLKEEEPRGRTLAERMGQRKRSRSPSFGRLSRSPHRDDRFKDAAPMRPNNGYRQRSPIRRERRRTPSPYRHASPPRFNPAPFEPKQPQLAAPKASEQNHNRPIGESRVHPDTPRNSYDMSGILSEAPNLQQGALREISKNISASTNLFNVHHNSGHKTPVPRGSIVVDDPYFVLGVTKSAGNAAIMEAFHDRIREVESERALEIDIDFELSNDYDKSIHILHAAKNQLLGL